MKDEKRKDTESLETKLRASEIEKAEFSAREQSARENLAQIQKDKERIELEYEDRQRALRKETQRIVDEVNSRM